MEDLEQRSVECAALDDKKAQLIKDLISHAKGLKKSLEEALSINGQKARDLDARDAKIADLVDKLDQAEARVVAQEHVIKDLHERVNIDDSKARTWLDTFKKIGALVHAIEMTEDVIEPLNRVKTRSTGESSISVSTQTDNGSFKGSQSFADAETQDNASPATLDKPASIFSSLPVVAQIALQALFFSKQTQYEGYISVLVDGSSMPFKDSLVQKGFDGGREAARLLRSSILRHHGSLGHRVDGLGMIIHIVDNRSTVRQRYTGIVHSAIWEEFVRGFCQMYHKYYYIDRLAKLASLLWTHANDANCKHVYLGASGDGFNYAQLLPLYASGHGSQDRITLLQGPPCPSDMENN